MHHILFVDDDVLTQWIMTEVMSGAGFAVTSACRGADAASRMDGTDEFDLLLTDFDLPGDIGSLQLSSVWRRRYPGRPIIYSTSSVLAVSGRPDRDEAFIGRPIDPAVLLAAIDDLLLNRWVRPGLGSGGPLELIH